MIKDEKYPNLKNCNPSECYSSRIMKCNRVIANIFRKHLKAFDITDSQLSILFVISKMKDVNQKIISDYLILEKSTVNRNLKRLVDKKYIEVQHQFTYNTSDKGNQFLEKVIPHWQKAMDETAIILEDVGVSSLNKLTAQLTITK